MLISISETYDEHRYFLSVKVKRIDNPWINLLFRTIQKNTRLFIEVTTSIVLNNGFAGDVESTEKTVENDRKAWGMPPFANSNLVNLTEDEYLEVVMNIDA